MTILSPDTTLADIVNLRPSLARELEARGLDYCCGGAATLETACAARDLDLDTVITDLTAATTDEQPEAWSTIGIAQLVDHLEVTHHAYLWAELPRLSALVDKVVAAHGERHSELVEIAACFEEIRARSRAAPRQGGAGAVPDDPCAGRRRCRPGLPVRLDRESDLRHDERARHGRRAVAPAPCTRR